MRIVLSRKGWDSGSGGRPNLIFDETGEMVMLPIPEYENDVTYDKLHLSRDENIRNHLKRIVPAHCQKTNIPFTCHADPNLRNLFGRKEYQGSLGQVSTSQTHLKNQKIKVGDVFIFFGLFNHVILKNGELRIRSRYPGHVIFGYLQIGDIISPKDYNKEGRAEIESKYPWITDQPHWNAEKYKKYSNNCIYVAAEHCTFNKSLPGCGTFDYHEELNLSMRDIPQSTHWNLPLELRNLSITYCPTGMVDDKYFQAPARGQELVIEDSPAASKWAEKLITKHARKSEI